MIITIQYSLEDRILTFCEDSVKNKQSLYKWLYETYENDLFSYGIAFGISKELLEDAIHDVFCIYMSVSTNFGKVRI